MTKRTSHQLQVLHRVSRTLAETKDFKEVKSIRDKAEAARHYARSAALGLEIQNQAAEVKLRAERRAGELLAELITRGGDRKSNARAESLTLAALGIGHNQSSRWQREAAVPEEDFEAYLLSSRESGRDVTTQGLLRLARASAQKAARETRSSVDDHFSAQRNGNGVPPPVSSRFPQETPSLPRELFDELRNHWQLFTGMLKPVMEGQSNQFAPSERRMIARLTTEIERLHEHLGEMFCQMPGG